MCREEKKVDHDGQMTLDDYCKCVMVVGGVGFVGSHISDALLREGRTVVVYDAFIDTETSKRSEKEENAKLLQRTAAEYSASGATVFIVVGDIRDQEKTMDTIHEYGVTSCIHVGVLVDDRHSVKVPEEYVDVNVLGTLRLLDALGKCGVKMVVQASTTSVFGQQKASHGRKRKENADRHPINPYGASMAAADAFGHCFSHLYGMNLTQIRFASTYGPRGRADMFPRILIENIINDKIIRKFGDGTACRGWLYVSDLVSVFLSALKKPQNGFVEYNVGTTKSTTLNQLIACAEYVTGKAAKLEHVPVPPGDPHTVNLPSFDKIRKELDWDPVVDIEEGMRLTYLDYIARKRMQVE